MILRPITLRAANAFVAEHHRHNKPARGHKFSIAAYVGAKLVGVAIVGRPVARELDDGWTAEILRVCVPEDAPRNACSFLYASARRAWRTMGGQKVITYNLQEESGASLRGAGFTCVAKLPGRKGKAWNNRDGRANQEVVRQAKFRWEAA